MMDIFFDVGDNCIYVFIYFCWFFICMYKLILFIVYIDFDCCFVEIDFNVDFFRYVVSYFYLFKIV